MLSPDLVFLLFVVGLLASTARRARRAKSLWLD
jgi:hypothetical protein